MSAEKLPSNNIKKVISLPETTTQRSPVKRVNKNQCGGGNNTLRGGAEVARENHNLEVAGSNPVPATQRIMRVRVVGLTHWAHNPT